MLQHFSIRRTTVLLCLAALICMGGWLGWRAAQQQIPVALLALSGTVLEEIPPLEIEGKVTVEAVSGTPIYAMSDGIVSETAHGFNFYFPEEKMTLSTLVPVDCIFSDGEAFSRGDIVAYVPRDGLGLRRPDQRVSFIAAKARDTAVYLHINQPGQN